MRIRTRLSSKEGKARALYEGAIVIDGCQSSEFTQGYFEAVREAGVTASIVTVAWKQGCHETMRLISKWKRKLVENGAHTRAFSASDSIILAKKAGKTAYVFGLQGCTSLEGSVDLLDVFRELGVRIVQLTYNERNDVGSGCAESNDEGLTAYGVRVIERLNALRMLVDLSHVGDRTTKDALELARMPVFSHANARAVCQNPRNKPDDQIVTVAEKGGIIGINAFPAFVRRTRMELGERPTLTDMLDHVDHIAGLVGPDFVGLGLDFIENHPEGEDQLLASNPRIWGLPNPDGEYRYPLGMATVSEVPNLSGALLGRGYTEEATKKILGENWLRVLHWSDVRI